MLLVAERLGRQCFWSLPRRWRDWVRALRSRAKSTPQRAGRGALKEHLYEIGVRSGELVMVHTSTSNLHFTGNPTLPESPNNFLSVAKAITDDLLDLLGPTGTLVMPTHAAYQFENDYAWPDDAAPPTKYNPLETPCSVGLTNEMFRRRKDVQRSLHPCNMLAACGPLAGELLHNNLNDLKPLPHGVHSAYYRFCRHNGLVVSIGVPLGLYMTLIHVAEEVRDTEWPIRNFFGEKRYVVQIDGRDLPCVGRERRPEYSMFCLCMRKLTRDLVREGILHEGLVGSVRVDWAKANEVFEYMTSRNRNSTYPYYWPRLVRLKKAARRE